MVDHAPHVGALIRGPLTNYLVPVPSLQHQTYIKRVVIRRYRMYVTNTLKLPILKWCLEAGRPTTTASHQEGSARGVQHSALPSPCCCFPPNKVHTPGGSRQLHGAPDGL